MVTLFYILAFLSVVSALAVVLLKKPIYSALSLVLTFFFLGGIYIVLNAEFVAVIQVLVYAGAIMVLFLFVMMLLKQKDSEEAANQGVLKKLLGGGLAIVIFFQIASIFSGDELQLGPQGPYAVEAIAEEGSIALIGRLLYGEYVLPFELISIVLLVAVLGAVVIAKRRLN